MSKGKSRRQGSKQFLACLQTNGKYESQRGHSPHPAAGTGVGSACSVQPACRSRGPTTEAAAWKELQPWHSYLCYSDPPIWKEKKHPKEVLSRCSCWNEQNQAGVQSFPLHLPVDHSCILHQQTKLLAPLNSSSPKPLSARLQRGQKTTDVGRLPTEDESRGLKTGQEGMPKSHKEWEAESRSSLGVAE